MPVTVKSKLNSDPQKRPISGDLIQGELSVNNNPAEPGIYFKTTTNSIIKIGPIHVGLQPPNNVPFTGGSIGNSTGEGWFDLNDNKLKVWTGSWTEAIPDSVPRKDGETGSAVIPSGTTAQRPASAVDGDFRYNEDNQELEYYRAGSWINIFDSNNGVFVVRTSDTGAAVIPSGTNVERPATPQVGYFRNNTDLNRLESYDGTAWQSLITQEYVDATLVKKTGSNSSAIIPNGTTAQRDGTPVLGLFRINSDDLLPEFYNSSVWKSLATTDFEGFVPSVSPTDNTDKVNSSGASALARGNLASRPSVSFGGYVRYRSDIDKLEFYNSSESDYEVLTSQTSDTGAVILPSSVTGNRPASPSDGNFRHNTTSEKLEFHQSSNWYDLLDSRDIDNFIEKNGSNAAIPVGNTAGRIDTQGYFRYNSELSQPEIYDGTAWQNIVLGTGSFVVQSGSNAAIPVGNTAGRTDTQGYFRYNSELSQLEFYNGTIWIKVLDATETNFVTVDSVNQTNAELPTGNTSQRVDSIGNFRLNTQIGEIEFYNSAWFSLATKDYVDNSNFVKLDSSNQTNAEIPTGTTGQRINSIGNFRYNEDLRQLEYYGEIDTQQLWIGVPPLIRESSVSDIILTSWSQLQSVIDELSNTVMRKNDTINIILPAGNISATSQIVINKDLGNVVITGQPLSGVQPFDLSTAGGTGVQAGDGWAYYETPTLAEINGTRGTNISFMQSRFGTRVNINNAALTASGGRAFLINEGGKLGGIKNIGFFSSNSSETNRAIEISENSFVESLDSCSCVGGSNFLALRDSSYIADLRNISIANCTGNGIFINQSSAWEAGNSGFITVNMCVGNGLLISNSSNIEQKNFFKCEANLQNGIFVQRGSTASFDNAEYSFSFNSGSGAEIRTNGSVIIDISLSGTAIISGNGLYNIWTEDAGLFGTASRPGATFNINNSVDYGIVCAYSSNVRIDNNIDFIGNGNSNQVLAVGGLIRSENAGIPWTGVESLGGLVSPPST